MQILQIKLAYCNFFFVKEKRYEIVSPRAVIVTSCHTSAEFASTGNMFFSSSNNFTILSLQFLQIFAACAPLEPRWEARIHQYNGELNAFTEGRRSATRRLCISTIHA